MADKCTFCGSELVRGTGTMFVKNDGRTFYFCSRKCEKALLEHGREPRRFKWTASYDRGTPAVKGAAKAPVKKEAAKSQ